jgi:transposase InsO family protein
LGKQRGRLNTAKERTKILELIDEAQKAGARLAIACKIIGLTAKSIQRWRQREDQVDGRITAKKQPANKLTELEQQCILTTASSDEFASMPPNKIVAALLDEGIYIASQSSFYRVLNAHKQLKHREKSKPANVVKKPQPLTATKPNEVYTWDITYLPSAIKGQFFYLYMIMDLFSRKIVGWQVHEQELSELAADLMKDICQREGIEAHQVTLHSDNGSPMKGATMLATLQELGIMSSFSRPAVSNDNPYSESLFRTLKYRPEYPEKPFADLSAARAWVSDFVDWYNNEHKHSAIKYVTPAQRHAGEDKAILLNRQRVNDEAKRRNPSRWSGKTRNWSRITEVKLNHDKGKTEIKEKKAA